MAGLTRAGLELKDYPGVGISTPIQPVPSVSTPRQRREMMRQCKLDMFVPGVVVESGVRYNVQEVPYKPAVVVPFEWCPKIHSDIMEEPDVVLFEDNPLIDEMDIKQGHTMLDQLCEETLDDPRLPKDPESLYYHIKDLQDPTIVTVVLDISQHLSAGPSTTKDTKHTHTYYGS